MQKRPTSADTDGTVQHLGLSIINEEKDSFKEDSFKSVEDLNPKNSEKLNKLGALRNIEIYTGYNNDPIQKFWLMVGNRTTGKTDKNTTGLDNFRKEKKEPSDGFEASVQTGESLKAVGEDITKNNLENNPDKSDEINTLNSPIASDILKTSISRKTFDELKVSNSFRTSSECYDCNIVKSSDVPKASDSCKAFYVLNSVKSYDEIKASNSVKSSDELRDSDSIKTCSEFYASNSVKSAEELNKSFHGGSTTSGEISNNPKQSDQFRASINAITFNFNYNDSVRVSIDKSAESLFKSVLANRKDPSIEMSNHLETWTHVELPTENWGQNVQSLKDTRISEKLSVAWNTNKQNKEEVISGMRSRMSSKNMDLVQIFSKFPPKHFDSNTSFSSVQASFDTLDDEGIDQYELASNIDFGSFVGTAELREDDISKVLVKYLESEMGVESSDKFRSNPPKQIETNEPIINLVESTNFWSTEDLVWIK